ncbi:hypothetical protein H1P_800002 [Hyella patelloides LEGE 07179]|uniref:Uncharacterized protein n=1 Tax=Hyella patelloides LEGE 07179 TaxID=945734 RepID=A0A563W491_9CYAN|nr:hypothetical protein H1P_800002 [Hyella patelloides LEGE 07179]
MLLIVTKNRGRRSTASPAFARRGTVDSMNMIQDTFLGQLCQRNVKIPKKLRIDRNFGQFT